MNGTRDHVEIHVPPAPATAGRGFVWLDELNESGVYERRLSGAPLFADQ